jgi:hypothetical protein
MPDRTIDFKLTAKDGASAVFQMAADEVSKMRAEVEKDLRDIGTTATKTRGAVARAGAGGVGGRFGGPTPQQLTGFKAINQEKEGLERALKLGGAVGILAMVSNAARGVTEGLTKYEQMLKEGYSRGQAFRYRRPNRCHGHAECCGVAW